MLVIDHADYVKAYKHIVKAADENNLILVSPTVRRGTGEEGNARWMATFYVLCSLDTDCDINRIQVLDLHWYRCNPDSFTGTSGILEQTRADLISETQLMAQHCVLHCTMRVRAPSGCLPWHRSFGHTTSRT